MSAETVEVREYEGWSATLPARDGTRTVLSPQRGSAAVLAATASLTRTLLAAGASLVPDHPVTVAFVYDLERGTARARASARGIVLPRGGAS